MILEAANGFLFVVACDTGTYNYAAKLFTMVDRKTAMRQKGKLQTRMHVNTRQLSTDLANKIHKWIIARAQKLCSH